MKTCSKLACSLLSVILLLPCSSFGQSKINPIDNGFKSGSESGVYFIENAGQVHDEFDQPRPDVVAVGVSAMSQLLIKSSGYSHQLNRLHYRVTDEESQADDLEPRLVDSVQFSRVDLNWLGANREGLVEKIEQQRKAHNYYNLPLQPEGITGVREFESIRLKDVYSGIDVRFYDANGLFEHDYEIAPGADYRDIRVEIKGADAFLNNKGELVLETALGTVTESSPRVFQNGDEIESRWVRLEENVWGFEVPEAHPELAMVIDPISRVWGTYFGGNNLDEIFFTKVDSEDNVYVGGGTTSPMNIATAGTEQTTIASGSDAFLAKFDSDGNQIWGTYLGGNGNEATRGLDFDEFGNIFIIGYTESTNNISTPGSHQEVKGDAGNLFDGFLIKFSPDGIREWGTYYGGLYDDRPRFVHIGADGHIFVTGVTTSENDIATPGSHQEVYLDGTDDFGNDAFLVKFTEDGVRLWATYYGGLLEDQAFTMTTDSDLNIYMIGHAVSLSNIATPGSFQPDHGGGEWDLFLVKFNPEGVREWATYFGGNGDEYTWNSCISGNNAIYITGRTTSNNAIATDGTHQEFLAGSFDAFLMKISLDGDKLWGTYFGGSNFERAYGCECLDDGSVIIAGRTESDNLISTPGVHQESHGGGIDAFLSKFNSDGTLDWSTYYGGNSNDIGYGSSMDSEGAIYLAGWSESDADISTSGIHQEIYAGQRDAFIAKFGVCANTFHAISVESCGSYTAPSGEMYFESGTYIDIIPNSLLCDSIITIDATIFEEYEIIESPFICRNSEYVLPDGTTTNEGGIYEFTFTSTEGCDSTVIVNLSFDPYITSNIDVSLCEGESYLLPDGSMTEPVANTEIELLIEGSGDCDTLYTISIEVIPVFEETNAFTICEGESIELPDGAVVSETGLYTSELLSINGCDSVIQTNLTVTPLPNISLNLDSVYCYNAGLIPLEADPPGGVFSGTFVIGNTLNLDSVPGGNYSVVYTYSENGCETEITHNYNVVPYLSPDFNAHFDCINSVAFTNSTASSNDYTFFWTIEDSLFSIEHAPTYTYSDPGIFTISLNITDDDGCVHAVSKAVEFHDGISIDDLFIPNIITPNGDGRNDAFIIEPKDSECFEYEVVIFNRWGLKVYETIQGGPPFSGKTAIGENLVDGTYFYILESPQIDCNDPVWGQFCKGTLTIVR